MSNTNLFKKYPAYKDSGVDWLGEIPMSWELLTNKYIFTLKKEQVGSNAKNFKLLSLTSKGIIVRDMESPSGKFSAEFDTYQKIIKDDFVFCLFDVEETPRCVGFPEFNCMITGAYTVMESIYDNCKFLYYFYLNIDTDKRMNLLYAGLRSTISKDKFFSFKSYIPSLEQQITIAEYIDKETAKIDQGIRNIGRLRDVNICFQKSINAQKKEKTSYCQSPFRHALVQTLRNSINLDQ